MKGCRKIERGNMAHAFYPFVDNDGQEGTSSPATTAVPSAAAAYPAAPTAPAPTSNPAATAPEPTLGEPAFPARIAVYDDAAVAPRVVIVDPTDVRSYLEEITQEVTRLSHEQGGRIPFTVIREIVENFVHAYFIEPAISILPGGNTIRFSDQGPGIKEKERALEFGTTSATREMKRYIRGTGSGLPLAQQYLLDKGGSLVIEDNMARGTVVTISLGEGHVAPGMHYFPQDMSPVRDIPAAQPFAQSPSPIVSPRPSTTTPAPTVAPLPRVDERGQKIIAYLSQSEAVGPKELVTAYGESNSTWSRALKKLTEAGLIYKEQGGQKYHLTQAARALL